MSTTKKSNFRNNMKIKTKALLGFASLLVVFAAVAGLGYANLVTINHEMELYSHEVQESDAAIYMSVAREHGLEAEVYANIMIGRRDDGFTAKVHQQFDEVHAALKALGPTWKTDQEKAQFVVLSAEFENYIQAFEKMVEDGEKYKADDETMREKVECKNSFENTLYNAQSTISTDNVKEQLEETDKEKIEKLIEEGFKSLSSDSVTIEEYKQKEIEFNETMSSIMEKVKQPDGTDEPAPAPSSDTGMPSEMPSGMNIEEMMKDPAMMEKAQNMMKDPAMMEKMKNMMGGSPTAPAASTAPTAPTATASPSIDSVD